MTAPSLAVTTNTGARVYRHPISGEEVPSVTTVIKGGVPKPALIPWAAKMAAEHAVANWTRLSTVPHVQRINEIKNAHRTYTEERATVGDLVHTLIECWSTGTPYPRWGDEVDSFANQFISFMIAKRPEFIENEATLWSRSHGYAGTLDFIARIGGRVILGDVKTGKRVYPEVGLQLAALANADFLIRATGEEEPIPPVDAMAALHVRPRSWKLVEVDRTAECFGAFLAAKEVMNWDRNVAPHVLRDAA